MSNKSAYFNPLLSIDFNDLEGDNSCFSCKHRKNIAIWTMENGVLVKKIASKCYHRGVSVPSAMKRRTVCKEYERTDRIGEGTYQCEVSYTITGTKTITVNAPTRDDASDIACERIAGYDLSDGDLDVDVESVKVLELPVGVCKEEGQWCFWEEADGS